MAPRDVATERIIIALTTEEAAEEVGNFLKQNNLSLRVEKHSGQPGGTVGVPQTIAEILDFISQLGTKGKH